MSRNIRRARVAMLIGALLLAAAAGLTLWDLSAGDGSGGPTIITGDLDSP